MSVPLTESETTWFSHPVEGGAGLVTLVEGSAFCVAGRSADIRPGGSQGLYFLDTRLLSNLEMLVDGEPLEPLAVSMEDPFSAVHVLRGPPPTGGGDAPLNVIRRRYVGRGMRDEVEVRNYGTEAVDCVVELRVDCDFADLFAVKEGHPDPGRDRSRRTEDGTLLFGIENVKPDREVSVTFSPEPDDVGPDAVRWVVHLPPGASWNLCNEVAVSLDGSRIELSHPCAVPVEHAKPAERLALWREAAPRVTTNHLPLAVAVRRAAEDLGALRIFDPQHLDRVVVAAGAPWFMTLFGRDSLLTAWMALIVDPALALGVLQTLADLQGEDIDHNTEEQPGRILHEVRFGKAPSLSLGGGHVYYGSVDATPLFVMLLGELHRWGLAETTVQELLPHADRALHWVEQFGDRDGDGYVEYERLNPRGLLHQGWKDSTDGIRYADGRIAAPPLALCEVQGYVYAAYLARARLASESGDRATAEHYRDRAMSLKASFNQDFWLEERGWYAMALDADKQPVDAMASNIGHCLWTGIVDEERAPMVARRLSSPEMSSGWGLRTLGSSMPAYNPVSYHCGSVWPHDTAVAAAGLMRYGFVEESHDLILGLLDLASTDDGRLPELVSGFPRSQFDTPVPYPTSCSPQAWAAAAPLLLLRTLLRFDPSVSLGQVFVDPALPPVMNRLHVDGIPLEEDRVSIDIEDGEIEVSGLPEDVELATGPRTETGAIR